MATAIRNHGFVPSNTLSDHPMGRECGFEFRTASQRKPCIRTAISTTPVSRAAPTAIAQSGIVLPRKL